MSVDTSIQKTQEGDEPKRDKDYYKIIQHIVENQYNITWDNKIVLDTKAQNIIIFSGIIASIFIGVATLLIRDELTSKVIHINLYELIIVIFAIGIMLVIFSIYYALRAYNLREWKIASQPEEIVSAIDEEKDINKILEDLSKLTCDAIKSNDAVCEDRAKKIDYAIKFLVTGILICAITGMIVMIVILLS